MNEKTKEILIEQKERIDKLDVKFNYTSDDMLDVKDYIASNTTVITTEFGTATKCDVSDERIHKFALSIGLVEIGGEKVTEENLTELLDKYCETPTGYSWLYYRMVKEAFEKK